MPCCVMQRAMDFARFHAAAEVAERGRAGAADDKHPVSKLLRDPNWMQTWYEFAVQMHVALLCGSNAYAVILRDPEGNPQTHSGQSGRGHGAGAADGQVFYNVNRVGFQMAVFARPCRWRFPPKTCCTCARSRSTCWSARPRSGLRATRIGLAMGLEQQAARFVGNGARPSGVLTTSEGG